MTDESPGPIFRLPRPFWHYIIPGLLGLFWFSVALFVEYHLLQPRLTTDRIPGRIEPVSDRWPSIAIFGVMLVLAPTIPLRTALTSPLVIRKQGIEIPRKKLQVGYFGSFYLWLAHWLSSTIRWIDRFGRWEFDLIPWEQVGPCHWGQYNRGTLTIHGPDGLVFIPIPERYRAEVEAAFRQFGKWRD